MATDLVQMESDLVAQHLLGLSSSDGHPSRNQSIYDGPTDDLDEAMSFYDHFEKLGELAALGQSLVRFPWTLEREAVMIGGGKIYFIVDNIPITDIERLDSIAWSIPLCLTYSQEDNSENNSKLNLEQRRIVLGLSPSVNHNLEDLLPKSYVRPSEPVESLVALRVRVLKTAKSPSDLIGPATSFVVTNWNFIYQPENQWYCLEPGPMFIVPSTATGVNQFRSQADLTSSVLNVSHRWGIIESDPGQSYLKLRSRWENDKVKLPIVGIEVLRSAAFLFLTIFSAGLLINFSFVLRRIVSSTEFSGSVLWMPLYTMSVKMEFGGGMIGVAVGYAAILTNAILVFLALVSPVVLTAYSFIALSHSFALSLLSIALVVLSGGIASKGGAAYVELVKRATRHQWPSPLK